MSTLISRLPLVVAAAAMASAWFLTDALGRDTAMPDTSAARPVGATLAALRQGGYVMVVRNAATEPNDGECLSDLGRLGASGIGALLAREHVPLKAIHASTDSGSAETASRIALRVLPGMQVMPLASAKTSSDAATTALRRLTSTSPGSIANLLVVVRNEQLQGVLGIAGVKEGEIVVLRPQESDLAERPLVFARLTLNDLSAYTAAHRTHARARSSL
ncbi:MAG TPA: hypothetical protein VJ608_04955 [Albitalea sp.]|nr:hypothetical protein [Albitalea sp.]